MTLHVGDLHRVTATFRNAAGVATNPSTVTLKIQKPDGAVTAVTPTSDGAGVYHHDIAIDQTRRWEYAFIGTGAVATAEPGWFYVTRSRVIEAAVTP